MRHIRDKFGDIIYCIRDDGTITDRFDCDIIGHLKGDRITDKFDIDTLYRIRQDGTITDKYDCEIIGHIRDDGSITDKYDIDRYGRVDDSSSSRSNTSTRYYSANSESGGFLETVFALVGAIFYFIVRVTIFQLVYIQIPGLSYCTLAGWICLLIGVGAASIGLVPVVYILLIPLLTIILLFFPYYIFAIAVKVKIKCSKIEFLKFFWKWFLKGPLAYPELINVMEENNIMPKVTKVVNKIIDFLKEKFQKK